MILAAMMILIIIGLLGIYLVIGIGIVIVSWSMKQINRENLKI